MDPQPIDTLKRAHLRVGLAGDNPVMADWAFIVGVNAAGLIPFEHHLCGHMPGDHLAIDVPEGGTATFFEHLLVPLKMALGLTQIPSSLSLAIDIVSVDTPDSRSVVQAMAQGVGHGGCDCGGDCGCGC